MEEERKAILRGKEAHHLPLKSVENSFLKKINIRTKAGGEKQLIVNKSKAIKIFCTECMGWEAHPNECTSINCALYPWRGKSREATSES